MFQSADEACAALAAHLGSRQYFGGDKPSSLDAAAFPMLCFALRAPVVRVGGRSRPRPRAPQWLPATAQVAREEVCVWWVE